MNRNVPNRGRAVVRGKAQAGRGPTMPGLTKFTMANALESIESLVSEYQVIQGPMVDQNKLQTANKIEKAYMQNDFKVLETYCNFHKGLMADIINTSMSNSLLHRACKKGNVKAVEIFLKCGANVNLMNKSLRTPLHKCYAYLGIAKIMIGCRPNLNAKDKKGQTPVHRAAIKNSLEVIRELIMAGADFHIRDNEGNLPTSYINDKNMARQFERLYCWYKSRAPIFVYKFSHFSQLPAPIFKEVLNFL